MIHIGKIKKNEFELYFSCLDISIETGPANEQKQSQEYIIDDELLSIFV